MPNLGAMVSEAGPPTEKVPPPPKGSAAATAAGAGARGRPSPTILADLPGLVQGAHAGKGLGRVFLRHLRRVRVVLYIIDTASTDQTATEQYEALRDELRLYNPQYLERPHVVALSKLDLAEAKGEEALAQARKANTKAIAASAAAATNVTAVPEAIVPISGLKGKGMRILKQAIDAALARSSEAEQSTL